MQPGELVHPIRLLETSGCCQIPTTHWEGREICWLKDGWQASRRYSIIAFQLSLAALNVLFLIGKLESDLPDEYSRILLFLLSCSGILSLHYTADIAWKSVQDTLFALKVKHYPIAGAAALRTGTKINSSLLIIAGFAAALEGAAGNKSLQSKIYNRMIAWGEVSLGVNLAFLFVNLLIAYLTLNRVKAGSQAPSDAAMIRYAMDKDTLWHLIPLAGDLDPQEAVQVVIENLETQLKVTLGAQLGLTLIGDLLQAIEKYFTPDSLVSAGINTGVSLAYLGWIIAEKRREYTQRGELDKIAENRTIIPLRDRMEINCTLSEERDASDAAQNDEGIVKAPIPEEFCAADGASQPSESVQVVFIRSLRS